MNIDPYVDEIHAQLAAAAGTGGQEARELAERLASSLDAAIRLALHHALAAAAEEITVELAPGSVEVRLRGADPTFVVTAPPADPPEEGSDEPLETWTGSHGEGDERAVARINLRMPEPLKARVERAADGEGLSINTWLVRAAAGRLERSEGRPRGERRAPHGAQRYQGWAR